MTTRLILIAIPCIAVVLAWALRCPCTHELLDRDSNGLPLLRCSRCLRTRPNILGGAKPAYRQTQSGGITVTPTGIERELAAYQAEADAVSAAIAQIESRERRSRAGLTVVRRYEAKGE